MRLNASWLAPMRHCEVVTQVKEKVVHIMFVAELVDTFVATHSSDKKFLEDKAAAGSAKVGQELSSFHGHQLHVCPHMKCSIRK